MSPAPRCLSQCIVELFDMDVGHFDIECLLSAVNNRQQILLHFAWAPGSAVGEFDRHVAGDLGLGEVALDEF